MPTKPKVDTNKALDQYGYVGVLASKTPELKSLLARATKEEWNSARFERELADTKWWKARSERQRAVELQKATDPASWKSTLANKTTEITSLAARMGVQINAAYWAEKALRNDWDEAALRAVLFNNYDPRTTGGGEGAEIEEHLRKTYASFGIPVSDEKLNTMREQVLGGRQTIGGLDAIIRTGAKQHYPQFAQQLDAGQTIADIADPFIQQMANTLEISPTDIDLNDKYIKQALSAQDASGKPATMSLSQFERQLKQDARWGRTKQAKSEAYSLLEQVGKDWGFL